MLLKNQAYFAVSSTLLPHSRFDSYKSLFCLWKIFLIRIFCLFKKVKHDEELQGHIEINWRFSLGGWPWTTLGIVAA